MTTWVLMRGLMRESRHWGEFTLHFQNTVNPQHIVYIEFSGNGSLHEQSSACSVEEMLNYARDHLKRLGYAPPFSLLALSLGAMVAVAWSELHPGELEKMVLINTSLAGYNPFYHRLRPQNYPALVMLLYGSTAQRESLILKLTSTRSRTQNLQATLEKWVAYAEEYPVTRSNILRQLKAAVCYRAPPTPPLVPVLLLAGQQDQLVNAKCSNTLAQHWGCTIRLHPAAGHDMPLDDAVWVAQQVKEWLTS